ncbi:ribonuclease H1-like [Lutzomyia longipalpis]|uniref:ribonuclease H1-like n=1 Tax=Lutzomyia longipalpis TaxID=7200 RepID=UPI0024841D37|nr:ribonuclease H1-like [Lutzomyia longipalpis]
MACLAITGAIRTSPTAALEVILGLPPLPLFVKAEAEMSALRLSSVNEWKSGGTQVGHGKILNKAYRRLPKLKMREDFTSEQKVPKQCVQAFLHSRDEWANEAEAIISSNSISLFTDGSLMEGSAGAGYSCLDPPVSGSIPLGENTTVFQAEVTAIILGLLEVANANIENKSIRIFSDSRAAIQAISGWDTRSALVSECQKVIESVSQNCGVTLHWVPGHTGIMGNEEADRLAVAGAQSSFIGPEPAVGMALQSKKSLIKDDLRNSHQLAWRSTPKCRVSKIFMVDLLKSRTDFVVGSNRWKSRQFCNLVTGHCLRKHLHRLKLCNEIICRGCGEEEKTAVHYVCECPSLVNHRRLVWGKGFLTPSELPLLNPVSLMRFVRKTGWMN